MQYTLNEKVELSGVGMHTGTKATVVIKPAEPDEGITFVRSDLVEQPCIPALVKNVVEVERGITLGAGDTCIHTVEHLLAALSGLEITNAIIEVSGEEIPILDGSALPIIEAIDKVGIKKQFKPENIYRVKEPLTISKGETLLVLMPSTQLKVSYTLSFNHGLIKSQHRTIKITPDTFRKEVASARTFGFEEELDYLRERGLIKGGSLENAVVIGKEKMLNEEPLRYEDEFVRHKILDIIGDFSLLGMKLCAHIIAIKSGHETNVSIVNKLFNLYRKTYSGQKKFLNLLEHDEMLNVNKIMEILPHRYPMLLVDRIIGIEGSKKIIGLKNVTINEKFFNGHWPGTPVMPGVLIIEAMAQVAGVMLLRKAENLGKLPYFMGCNKVKWRYPVYPGDQLIMELETVKVGSRRGIIRGKSYVEGKLVCEGEFSFSLVQN